MDEQETEPLTKADFPDDAHAHMRDMTPEQRQHFLDWVNGLEYVTDKRWPGVLIAKEKWEWAKEKPTLAAKEFNAAALLASYLGREVMMLPEGYNRIEGDYQKTPDAVANDRTVDFKTSRRLQESYRDGRKQALDVFIMLPEFMDKDIAKERLHGVIDLLKREYVKKNKKIDFGGEVYIACAVADMFIHASVNTEGVARWDDASALVARQEPSAPARPTLENVTAKSELSRQNPTTGVKPEGCQDGSRPADKAMSKLFPKKPKITAGFASTNSIRRGQFSAAARSLVLILLASIVPVALAYEDYDDDDDGLAETDFSFSAVAGSRATQSRAMGVSWFQSTRPEGRDVSNHTTPAANCNSRARDGKALPPSDHVPSLAEYSAVSDIPGAVPAATPRHQEATTSAQSRRRETASYIDGLRQGRPAQGEIALPPETAAAIQSDSVVWAGEDVPGGALNPEDLPLPDLEDGPETQGLCVAATNSGRPTLPPPPERRIGDGERAAQTVTGLPLPVAAQAPRKTDAMERITLPPEKPVALPVAQKPQATLAQANNGAGRRAAPPQPQRPQIAHEAKPAPTAARPLTKAELAAIRPASPKWIVPEKGHTPTSLSNAALHLEAGGDDYAAQAAADYRQAATYSPAVLDDEAFEEPLDNCVWADGVLRFFYSQSRPLLRCSARNLTDVELHEGEAIATLRLGDTANWKVETLYVGRTPHLLINPRSNGQRTSMVIATDQRTYYFDLESHKGDHYGRVGFLYDEQPAIAAPGWRDQALHCAAILPGGAQLSGWVIALALALFGFLRVGIHAAKEK